MKGLIQWRHGIQKSIKTSYQIYATILLQRKIGEEKFDTDSIEIYDDSGALSCARPDEIDFISGTYKNLTRVTINAIIEGLKLAGCRSVSWIFQDDKKENIKIMI